MRPEVSAHHDQIRETTDRERARLEALTRVEAYLRQIRWGSVVVKVQDGRPVLVEKHEQEKIA